MRNPAPPRFVARTVARSLAIWVVAAALASPGAAQAADTVVEGTVERRPAELAQQLGIVHEQQSALLILAERPYDAVRIGLSGAADSILVTCAADSLGKACIRAVAHPLLPGHLDVSVTRGDTTWEGSFLLVAGDVAILNVERLLILAAAAKEDAPAEIDFDVFAFYDKLEARDGAASKRSYCDRVLAGLAPGEDATLVSEACDRSVRKAEEQAATEAADATVMQDDLELSDALGEPAESDPTIALLYRRDGVPRVRPRGTVPRGIAAAAMLVGVGVATYSAFYWEYQAELEYLEFRAAERVGDDPAMTRRLFFAKQYDTNRDIAIGVGIALAATAVSFGLHQLLERKLFLDAKATAAEPEAPKVGVMVGPSGAAFALSFDFAGPIRGRR